MFTVKKTQINLLTCWFHLVYPLNSSSKSKYTSHSHSSTKRNFKNKTTLSSTSTYIQSSTFHLSSEQITIPWKHHNIGKVNAKLFGCVAGAIWKSGNLHENTCKACRKWKKEGECQLKRGGLQARVNFIHGICERKEKRGDAFCGVWEIRFF